jgi:hypothetical protein
MKSLHEKYKMKNQKNIPLQFAIQCKKDSNTANHHLINIKS